MKDLDDLHSRIEDHINLCPDCSLKARALDGMVDSLKKHKDLLCPEQWELYEYAESGEDPTGRISKHVESCTRCGESVSEYKSAHQEDSPLPPALVKALEKQYPPQPQEPSTTSPAGGTLPTESSLEYAASQTAASPNIFSRISDFFSSFRFPIAAVAAAAAAAALVIFIYPRGGVEVGPTVRLSSVSWGRIPGLVLMQGNKPKVGMIISVNGGAGRWSQDRIDSLYKALKPTSQMKQHFSFATPLEIKSAISEGSVLSNRKDLVEKLAKDLTVASVLFIDVVPKGDGFDVSSELIDVKTGQAIEKSEEKDIPEKDLNQRIKESATALLGANSPDK